jgi:hypothetical protein
LESEELAVCGTDLCAAGGRGDPAGRGLFMIFVVVVLSNIVAVARLDSAIDNVEELKLHSSHWGDEDFADDEYPTHKI